MGITEARLNPWAAKRVQKRSTVSGLTASAPLAAMRQELRSRPSMSASAMRRRHSSKAKLGAAERVPR